jgi:hypothetical protein
MAEAAGSVRTGFVDYLMSKTKAATRFPEND